MPSVKDQVLWKREIIAAPAEAMPYKNSTVLTWTPMRFASTFAADGP